MKRQAPVHQEIFRIRSAWVAGLFSIWAFVVLRAYLPRNAIDQAVLNEILEPGQYAVMFSSSFLPVLGKEILALGAAAAIFTSWLGAGTILLRAFSLPPLTVLERRVFACGLGAGAWAVFLLAAGSAGWLGWWVLGVPLVVGCLAGIKECTGGGGRGQQRRAGAQPRPYATAPAGKWSGWDKVLLALLGLLVFVNLVATLSPEVFWDALEYHFGVPHQHLVQGAIRPLPRLLNSNFPQNVDMLYLLGLKLGGETTARLINFGLGVLILPLLAALAGRAGGTRTAALLAAAVFSATPLVSFNTWLTGVELGVTFFLLAGLLAIVVVSDPGPPSPGPLLLAGVFAGLAMGSKYTAILSVAALVVVLLRRRAGLTGIALFAGAAALCLAPWLVKNWWFTGNPVYPFLPSVFPVDIPHDRLAQFVREARFIGFHGPLSYLAFPWTVTMWQQDFGFFTGPAYLLGLPLLMLIRYGDGGRGRSPAPTRPPLRDRPYATAPTRHGLDSRLRGNDGTLACFALVAAVIGIPLAGQPRHLMPVMAVLAVLLALGIDRITDGPTGRGKPRPYAGGLIRMGMAALLLHNTYWITAHIYKADGWRVVVGEMTRAEFLSRDRPRFPASPFAAIQYANDHLPRESRILFLGDARIFHAERAVLVSSEYERSLLEDLLDRAGKPDDLYDGLRREGVTHLLVNGHWYRKVLGDALSRWGDREWDLLNRFWAGRVHAVYSANGVVLYELGTQGEGAPSPFLRPTSSAGKM